MTSQVELTADGCAAIEYSLKKRMATMMGSHQATRANNTKGLNVGNMDTYVQLARTLRKVIRANGRQQYKPVRGIYGAGKWVDDETLERSGVTRTDTLLEAVRAFHETGHLPDEAKPSAAEHKSVPGRP